MASRFSGTAPPCKDCHPKSPQHCPVPHMSASPALLFPQTKLPQPFQNADDTSCILGSCSFFSEPWLWKWFPVGVGMLWKDCTHLREGRWPIKVTPQWYSSDGDAVILQSHFEGIFSNLFFLKQNHIFIVSRITSGIRLKAHGALLLMPWKYWGLFWICFFCFFFFSAHNFKNKMQWIR